MARNKSFSNTWWGKQWIGVLESFGWANRLERGRRYARNGSVMELIIEKGQIKAKVQGSRSTPYKVVIKLEKFKKNQWNTVIEYLSTTALYAAKLLSGDMPEDIGEAFREVGLSLLPETEVDLDCTCSCPDYAVPCKHIAAVHYLIGEELDNDPFIIFRLRGLDRDELLSKLIKYGSKKSVTIANNDDDFTALFPPVITSSESDSRFETTHTVSLEEFWKGNSLPRLNPPSLPLTNAAAFKKEQNAFWSKDFPMYEIMKGIYRGRSKA